MHKVKKIRRDNKPMHPAVGYYYSIMLDDGTFLDSTDDALIGIYYGVIDSKVIERRGWHVLIGWPFPQTPLEMEAFDEFKRRVEEHQTN